MRSVLGIIVLLTGSLGTAQTAPQEKPQFVLGRVVDAASGAGVPGARVTLGPVSRPTVVGESVDAPVRPATDGRFVFAGLPAGEYYLAALTEAAPGEWSTARFLETIVPSALKVVVADGQKKIQDLQIAR